MPASCPVIKAADLVRRHTPDSMMDAERRTQMNFSTASAENLDRNVDSHTTENIPHDTMLFVLPAIFSRGKNEDKKRCMNPSNGKVHQKHSRTSREEVNMRKLHFVFQTYLLYGSVLVRSDKLTASCISTVNA
ncbi:hypothetical protein KIN20_020884 [Parelaphostrongylus tenuis]|uniref:Uncharacterized protein n=1 Tax=Parelaphostrongylus tenuis TaxID=148309 RepID=A0AAD5N779_PARTN|nr:hypothetical protein KIN20_020884 [Parelaphostrongylus tenuis]